MKMNEKPLEYVWYACYGSNINKARFMRYINSCSDTTEPTEARKFQLPYDIYFSGSCRSWDNKGVAYLDDTKEGHSYGKIYKVTKEQFQEIKKMEGRNYTKRIAMGEIEGLPVYTFTCRTQFENRSVPSVAYFETIHNGLKALYTNMEEKELGAYLVNQILTENQYQVLRAIRKSEHGISNQVITALTPLDMECVICTVRELLELKLIQQDKRSKNAGHEVDNPEAYFFTCKGMRGEIDKMVEMKEE